MSITTRTAMSMTTITTHQVEPTDLERGLGETLASVFEQLSSATKADARENLEREIATTIAQALAQHRTRVCDLLSLDKLEEGCLSAAALEDFEPASSARKLLSSHRRLTNNVHKVQSLARVVRKGFAE